MNKNRFITIIILLCLLAIFYFQFSLIVTPDSTSYYWYLSIFNGIQPLDTWSITRGPSFPLILFFITHLFGNNESGILIGFFIIYIIYLIFSYLILNKVLKELNVRSALIWFLYITLIMFNLLSIGYSHTLLTEAVAPAIIMLNTYLVYKWVDVSWHKSKKCSMMYLALFSLIVIFMWFLKQPYMPIIFFEIFIGAILIIIRNKNKITIIEKTFNIIILLGLLLTSIVGWNKFLSTNGVDTSASNSSSGFITKGILTSLNGYYKEVPKEDFCSINYINNSNLPQKEKENIINMSRENENWCNNVRIFDLIDNNGEQTSIVFDGAYASVGESIKFLTKNFFNHPISLMKLYYRNYMGTINLYPVELISYEGGYYTVNKFDFEFEAENKGIGLLPFKTTIKCWWDYPGWTDELKNQPDIKYMANFSGTQIIDQDTENTLENIGNIYLKLFKIISLLNVPLGIYCIYKYLKNKNSIVYYLTTVIFISSFLHILFHACLGGTIDRYAFPTFPLSLLGVLILFANYKFQKNINCKKDNQMKKVTINNNKTIFVIPAYNEEKNIESVIKDIKKNMPQADIVITNDCSTDNTKNIVEGLGVPCLNHPFNMGYSAAVQTGIKYAYENDYDYIIQFDADGQHLASEAKKLVETMKKTQADIVIGSRFLVPTDYNHPFFRKIGTKMFQIMIKIFCHKEITDPTSGFQILNKNVISRYAKIGKYPEFPDANLIIEMLLNGYKIEEVSVKMKENLEGKSMHGGIIKPIKYMINVTYSIIFILLRGTNIKKEGNK